MADLGFFLTWLAALAAAANGTPLPHVFPHSNNLVTAVAAASPQSAFILGASTLDYCQFPEFLTSHFYPACLKQVWGNGIFKRPAKSKSTANAIFWDVQLGAPLGNGERFAIVRDTPIVPSVVALLRLSGPSAIARFVVAVRIFAVQCVMRRWPLAHIHNEILELQPSLANQNATPAVVSVSRISGVQASAFHGCPRIVFGRFYHSVLSHYVQVKTPTTLGNPGSQAIAQHLNGFSAVARALPRSVADIGRNRESAETGVSQVDASRHFNSLESPPLRPHYYSEVCH